MKIRSLTIKNFKKIKDFQHDFTDPYTNEPRSITSVFGGNGSGKTTLLQAISFVLSYATRKISNPSDFNWHGFLFDRAISDDTFIELNIELNDNEVKQINEVFDIWKNLASDTSRYYTAPSQDKHITLVFDGKGLRWPKGFSQAFEMLGRYYTGGMVKHDRKYLKYYESIGGVFWFDQYRNLGSGHIEAETDQLDQSRISWQAGVEGLRKNLVGWWNYHQYQTASGKAEDDFIMRLQKTFSTVFPGTEFDGIEPMPAAGDSIPPDFYLMIKRGEIRYDISEMSSGEQALFSIVYDFVRQRIAHSVVLIDELEMHLHPPEQQSIYNALRKIGPSCQFIITSHSPYLEDIIPDESIIRLHEGRELK